MKYESSLLISYEVLGVFPLCSVCLKAVLTSHPKSCSLFAQFAARAASPRYSQERVHGTIVEHVRNFYPEEQCRFI
jgi:hypothetical protein